MKDMGKLQYKFLAIQVHRDRKINTSKFTNTATRTLFSNNLTWRTYLQSLRTQRPAQSSVNRPTNLCSTPADHKQYQSNVGSQMYDMLYMISQISQFSTNPSTLHETAAKRCLRYLNGTRNFGITYDGSKGLVLEGGQKVYFRITFQSLRQSNHLGI